MTALTPFIDEAIAAGLLARDPYPVYQRMRAESPICWSERWNCWMLCRHADVSATMQDFKRFANSGRLINGIKKMFPGEATGQLKPLMDHYSGGLIHSDPPDHTRIRKLVQATFQPRMLDRLRVHVQQIIDDLLDKVLPAGRMDIITDLAYPLPVTVIAELMGIPVEMRQEFKSWSQRTTEFQASPQPPLDAALRSQTALTELREYFRSIFAERRSNPREDLISELVNVHLDGQKLNEEELLSTCVSILIGGHETTTTLITSGIFLLLRHPEAMQMLREDPSLTQVAVEEFLRYEPPFQRIVRVARCDMELHGEQIKEGQTVMLLIGSANRDEAVFPNAETFDIKRTPNKHLSFGYGVHFCLGAGLARIEVPAAINSLLGRLPNMRSETAAITEDWHDGMVRSLTSLPIQFNA
jgi:cytochrome P450